MSADASGEPAHRPMSLFDDSTFRDLVARRAAPLLSTAQCLGNKAVGTELTRPLLGDLLFQASQLEELLDEYGAQHNRRWWRFRALTAAIKLFASVSYKLLHLHHVLPSYRLLPIERDFAAATEQALLFAGGVVEEATMRLVAEAERLDLLMPIHGLRAIDYSEHLPAGRLPHDRNERRIDSAARIVIQLATEFLSLASESEPLHTVATLRPEEPTTYCDDPMSEETLRYLTHRFHNLQSLYDTYVSETQVERLDADLPVLRGHVSVIFHLLEIATELAHYCQRHVRLQPCDSTEGDQPVVNVRAPLATLMDYAFTYASLYLTCGQRLCQEMLKRYAEVGQVEVSVPNYRGFHVRPATLVAKIVAHYGSDVRMELDGQSYDAISPLELFRANEKINAWKRRWLAREIAQLTLRQDAHDKGQIRTAVLDVVLTLAERGKLIIYEQPLSLSDTLDVREGGLLEQVTAEIARLQAMGQIDISTGLTITFTGDKRVLADIELLAKHGYGEDSFGNNIPLPKEISYLRR